MKIILRDFVSLAMTWLIISLSLPFIFFGFTTEAITRLPYTPFVFLIGLIPLLIGSLFWFAPILFFNDKSRNWVNHVWTAVGAAIAMWFYVELQFAGDPPPPTIQYWMPSLLALPVGFVISLLLSLHRKKPAEQDAAANPYHASHF